MILNGIDLVYISRFEHLMENKTFMNSIFLESELTYIKEHPNLSAIAGIYAAKEACLKALKKGINHYSLKDIEISHNKDNAPFIIFHNDLKKDFEIKSISLSISHDKDYAIAMVSILK